MSAISELSTIIALRPRRRRRSGPGQGGGPGQQGGLSVPAAVADRPGRDHDRADARLVVPVVHQLQPDPGAEVIGVDNYVRMLGDERLHNSLRVTFTYVFVSTPVQLAVALAIALLLNEGMQGLPFYRSVFYLPSMLGGSVAIAVLWRQMFEVDGLVNQAIRAVGIPVTRAGSVTRVPPCGPSSCCTCGRSARPW